MKVFTTILIVLLASKASASECLLPPQNINNIAKYLVSKAEVIFYGFPKLTATYVTNNNGDICFEKVTIFSVTKLIKGPPESVFESSNSYCLKPTSIQNETIETKLKFETNFSISLLALTKKEEKYQVDSCITSLYKSLGDSKFRSQLDLLPPN